MQSKNIFGKRIEEGIVRFKNNRLLKDASIIYFAIRQELYIRLLDNIQKIIKNFFQSMKMSSCNLKS